VSFEASFGGLHPFKRQHNEKKSGSDSKSLHTTPTKSISSVSEFTDTTSSDGSPPQMARRESGQHISPSEARETKNTSLQTKLFMINDLVTSNRSLEKENAAMKGEMREMHAKMKAMEESMQRRRPEKEKEMLDAIEALQKVIQYQEKKVCESEACQKKYKLKISRRDELIESLKKEIDHLKSACSGTESEYLSVHREASFLQKELSQSLNNIKECCAQLEHQKMMNSDLATQLAELESQLLNITTNTAQSSSRIKDIMEVTPTRSHASVASENTGEELTVMKTMAELEAKIKKRRMGFIFK